MFIKSLLILLILLSNTVMANDGEPFKIPRTKTVTLKDSNTGRLYRIHIQEPKKYNSAQKYPVVYMTDSPYTFPIVTGSARYPINFNKMENVMFVGVAWEKNYSPALSRQRDYTPTTSSPGYKDPSGQAEKHLSFIRNDVMNYVETHYSIDPKKRTYVGNSFGGLFGAYTLLTAPETFQNYILGSPSLWWDRKYILKLASKTDKLSNSVRAKVFIGIGANEQYQAFDMVEDARKFYRLLKAKEIPNLSLKLHVIESANHETAFPTSAIQGLWWLFKR